MTRKSRIQKRKANKRKSDRWGIVLISFAVLAVVAIFILRNSVLQNAEATNESTNCSVNIREEVVFLIDLTDSLNRTQDLIVRDTINSEVLSGDNQTRFSFYMITEDLDDFSSLLTICNPGDGSEANELVSNKRRLYQTWENDFKVHIDSIMHRISTSPEASQSPIVESLKIASVERFFNSKADKNRLVIISDLLQHSAGFTNYRTDYSPDAAQQSAFLIQNRPYLRNVEVEVMYVSRPSNASLQTNRHILFWQNLMEESGAYIKNIEVIR